ncbi:amino acid adenylation domain-containing protein [Actinoplanes sp. N902-109]|uniref:amino acid adenylation domain-containing protein n=1 Tax=Actinoplanes sp. (strain N902-109) TaxID=649831 RepID=UPI0003296529|nr:amino acid adenylation domain-containing protein [Actinoplanes sp. N902-109]AGL16385.1 amino acid adenylation domain-containing protein [Actinoplanes sp. N902-109]
MMLYQWFAASAARHGDQPALEIGGVRHSYRQLADMAEALAARIVHESDVVPARIGLLAERNLLAYVGYLAVQRLGSCVVPLNPAFPEARTRQMVAASGAGLVLADTRSAASGLTGVRTLALHPAREATGLPPALPLADAPESAAYLLFTSGSTGSPKGVPITHRNVSAFLTTVQDRYGLAPGARCSQTFDLTFDLSVFDMFAVWAAGATVVVASRNDLLRPVRFVADNALTHWFSVPSAISRAQASGRLAPDSMPSLRHSLFCGEPLTCQQARAWLAAASNSSLTNLYGPTELTISCSDYVVPRDPGDWPSTPTGILPIGLPYPGIEYAILDGSGRMVPEGELCMRGAQRFAGYLDPAANSGRFHPDIGAGAAVVAPDHWYRTGDRVTLRDGQLSFLGRTDQQIKINGYRVELGEIEAGLRDLAGVTDVVVVARPETADALGLYAVCVAPGQDPADLRAELARRLPSYMVPRRILLATKLPCNANGKLDRRAALSFVDSTIASTAVSRSVSG